MNHRNGYNHQPVDVDQAGGHHKMNHRNHHSSKPQERHHIRNREQEPHIRNQQQQALVQQHHIRNCETLVGQSSHRFGNRNLELQQEHRHNHNQQQGLAQLHNRKQVLQQQEQAFRKKRHNRLVLDQPSFVATL